MPMIPPNMPAQPITSIPMAAASAIRACAGRSSRCGRATSPMSINRGSGLRHFPADPPLTDWLTVKGIPFDVITGHDLDREGVSLLRPYRAVVTGSHPEYHAPNTLNALRDYVGNGGRLAPFPGGGGFS